jgi:hypothetical protein
VDVRDGIVQSPYCFFDLLNVDNRFQCIPEYISHVNKHETSFEVSLVQVALIFFASLPTLRSFPFFLFVLLQNPPPQNKTPRFEIVPDKLAGSPLARLRADLQRRDQELRRRRALA